MYKRYLKKKNGTICGFYIYHNFRVGEKISNIYLGKETDTLEEIELICNLIAQEFLSCFNLKDVNKYLKCRNEKKKMLTL